MEILVLDEAFEAVSVLDVYESLIWTDRFFECGDFEIYTPAKQSLVDGLKEGYYLWTSSSDHVMIIEDRKISCGVTDGNYFTVTGRSLESILDRRIVWNKTTLDGAVEGQIKKLLDQNIISPTDTNRKISNFIFEESGDPFIATLTVQAQFTGDNLYEVVKSICESLDIGFRIRLTDDNEFAFQLYSGVDRSYDQDTNINVVFSPDFDNIITSEYYESKQLMKNVTLVAGEGEDTNRKTLIVGETTLSGLSRRELYTDARDISSTTESGSTLTTAQYNQLLQQRGNEQLTENKMTRTFDGELETTIMYRYGEDFFMGDIVQLEDEYGMSSKARVIEYIRSENATGFSSYPKFDILEYE